ncbi:MAG: OmpH family outer membrane protein [Nitrospirota bacterium]
MKKLLWIVAVLILIAGSASAYSGKIAYFDIQTVMNKTTLGKKYLGIASGYYESRKRVLDADAEEIQKLQEDYDKQKQAKMNDPTRKEKEETLNRKIAEFEKIRAEFGDEISKKNMELSNEFNQHVFAVLKDIAKREKLSLILNRTISISKVEVQSVVYADEELDITGKIVTEMNKKEAVE